MAWKDRFVKNVNTEKKEQEKTEPRQEEVSHGAIIRRYKPEEKNEAVKFESTDFSDPFPDKNVKEEPVEPEELVLDTKEVTRITDSFREQQEKAKKAAEWYRAQLKTRKIEEPDERQNEFGWSETDREMMKPKQIEKKKLHIGTVLDCTYSFSTVYPAVYAVLKRFFTRLEQDKGQYKGFQLEYSLTLLHNKPETFLFNGRSEVTGSEKEVLNALETLEFYGGSDTGRENLNDALKKQLVTLNMESSQEEQNSYKGLLFFTDSLPEEGEKNPDLDEDEFAYNGNTYENAGLRFAEIYSYDGSYRPNLKMVDRNGWSDSENGRNEVDYYNIHTLLNGSTAQIAEDAERLVNNLILQASVQASVR